ncbi:MAG: RluA family pseudouridine synthase [Solirubrobacterales bacterium]
MKAQVGAGQGGERLDQVLSGFLGSRSRAQAQVAAGAVTVNGEAAAKSRRLEEGDLVEWSEPPQEPPAAPPDAPEVPYRIAWEDDRLLVVDKPAGVATHPSRGHESGTLSQALAGRAAGGEDPERPGIVHRLDLGTSGLLVVARDDETHRALQEAIGAREVKREYLALVGGRPRSRTGTVDAPIGRDRRRRTVQSVDTDKPREAVTHFEVEEELPHATLLRVTLETGRTHQIRAHLAAIGLPVAGDPEYGTPGALGLDRQFLHAARLAFAHPSGGEVDVSSPLPADLEEALARARAGEEPVAAPPG